MSEQKALLKTIIDFPEDDTPRRILADWYDENNEPGKAEFIRLSLDGSPVEPDTSIRGVEGHYRGGFINRVKTTWAIWRSTSPFYNDHPVTDVELEECPQVVFGGIRERQYEDKRDRVTTLRLEWEEWDTATEQPQVQRWSIACSISHREMALARFDMSRDARIQLEHRARQARTPVGYLSRLWPRVRRWTFPDGVDEDPPRTLLLSPEEAFVIAGDREVRDHMVRSPYAMTDLNTYGLPRTFIGLNPVVDPDVPSRNDPFPGLDGRRIREWLRSPRTYQVQDKQ